MAFKARVTERSTYKDCRRQWGYAYREGLIPLDPSRDARWVGTGGHTALAAYYRREDPLGALEAWYQQELPPHIWGTLSRDQQTEISEKYSLLRAIVANYVERYAPNHDNFDIVAVEKDLQVRISGTYCWLEGRVDLLVRRKGRLWIVDHKFVSSLTDESTLSLNDQMSAYLWLVWQTYKEVPEGALYNQVLKKVPSEPRILKDGTLSRDKGQNTTSALYREALAERGLDERDYQDVLEALDRVEFIRRVEICRPRSELEVLTSQLRDELLEMRQVARGSLSVYPNMTDRCRWGCDYRSLCQVESEGGNADLLRQLAFSRDGTEAR